MKCDGLVTEETNVRMNFETATTAAPASIFWVFFLFFFFFLFIHLFIYSLKMSNKFTGSLDFRILPYFFRLQGTRQPKMAFEMRHLLPII